MGAIDTKAVLLVGGLGTRLRDLVPSSPKALAPVGARPFLELLIGRLRDQGIKNLVMCTGYLADQIESEFGQGTAMHVTIEYSREPHPLGTGGAVKFAEKHLRDLPDFLVMNGDSFLAVDFRELIRLHRDRNAVATIAVVRVEDAGRYGTVITDSSDRVLEFREKTGDPSPGLINAGVYVFSSQVFEYMSPGPGSLERDVFPKLIDKGVYVARQDGMFIDIGTPADYLHAQQLLDFSGRVATDLKS